jgi:hypothetical protein
MPTTECAESRKFDKHRAVKNVYTPLGTHAVKREGIHERTTTAKNMGILKYHPWQPLS